jgi:hypothetical protein
MVKTAFDVHEVQAEHLKTIRLAIEEQIGPRGWKSATQPGALERNLPVGPATIPER